MTPVPKPPKGKRNKNSRHVTNARPDKYEHCEAPGCPDAWQETHEVWGGSKRNASIKHGMQAKLCSPHHRDPKLGVHGENIELKTHLKRKYQAIFERNHTREEYRATFGKSYLE